MYRVWLTESPASTTISLSSILAELHCHVEYPGTPPSADAPDRIDLAVIEFRPRVDGLAPFTPLPPSIREVPTIIVGPELPEQMVASLLAQSGAKAYLNSGVSAAELRESLCAHLPHVKVVALTVGRLHVSILEHSVRYGHHSLALTTTQFRLLCSMMQRPGHRFNCSSLEALAECRGVPAHLASLRRTLAAYSAAFLLRGTPHQGYVIDARRQPRTPNVGFALKNHLAHLI